MSLLVFGSGTDEMPEIEHIPVCPTVTFAIIFQQPFISHSCSDVVSVC